MTICSLFFNDTPSTKIYTLSLHDALPICKGPSGIFIGSPLRIACEKSRRGAIPPYAGKRDKAESLRVEDRKSTRLNSSHTVISYAVFCLKKKKKQQIFSYIYL